ncbi:MAG: mechanosensitive ion channel family protein [Acidimicrobiia bacterium]|jgi:moderate conductance mechanosensitive channel
MMLISSLLAQAPENTTDTTTPAIEVVDPLRPITELISDVFGLDPDGPVVRLFEALVEPIVQVMLVLAVAWLVIRVIRRIARSLFARAKRQTLSEFMGGETEEAPISTRKAQRLDAVQAVLGSVLGVVVWTVAILTIFGATFGISLAPFLAGAGIVGIALGFGAQHLVRDFVSGIFMLFEDQYGVGDVVDLGEATGVVEGMSLRTTRIRDVTGTVWHIPNGEIRRVGNMSQEWSASLLDIGVAYGADIDRAAEVIKSVADHMAAEEAYRKAFLAEPQIWGVENVAAEGVVLRLVIRTLPGEQWGISRELRRRIKYAFDEEGIGVPIPQHTVWLRADGQELPAEPAHPGSDSTAATGKGSAAEAAPQAPMGP